MARLETDLFGTASSAWQVAAGLLVLVGSLVTIGYTVVENFWG